MVRSISKDLLGFPPQAFTEFPHTGATSCMPLFSPENCGMEVITRAEELSVFFEPDLFKLHESGENGTMIGLTQAATRLVCQKSLPGQKGLVHIVSIGWLNSDQQEFTIFGLGDVWRDPQGNIYSPSLHYDIVTSSWRMAPQFIKAGFHSKCRVLVNRHHLSRKAHAH